MARTEGVYVADNSVTEIPDGGSVRVEVFNTTQNHATDTPLYTWPVSVQAGRFVIDIPQTTSNQYPDNIKLSIVATLATGESVRKLITGANGGTLLQRKGSVMVPVFLTADNTVFTSSDMAISWSGAPGMHYDLHVYTDAAHTTLAVSTKGNALDTNGIGTATSHTFNNVAEDGATLYPLLYAWEDSSLSGTPQTVSITVTASTGRATFADFGTTLAGSTHTFTVLNGVAGWRYDLIFNGSDTTDSVLWPVNEITRTGLPVDGGTYSVTLARWPDGDTSDIQYEEGTVTAFNQETSAPVGSQIIIPPSDISEGSYDATDWLAAIDGLTSTFWETTGTPVTTVSSVDGRRSIGVRLDATTSPSTRMAAGADLTPSQEMIIEQDIQFSDDFVWGGTNKGGKLGFGCGGGSRKSGGNAGPSDPDTQSGFTARLMWRATTESDGQIYGYLYHANTVGYGSDHATGFYPLRGQRFTVKQRTVMNSTAGVADGTYELWINGIKRLDLSGIEWFGTGTPQIDTLLTYTFHGGDDSSWSPPAGHVNHVYYSSIFFANENYTTPSVGFGRFEGPGFAMFSLTNLNHEPTASLFRNYTKVATKFTNHLSSISSVKSFQVDNNLPVNNNYGYSTGDGGVIKTDIVPEVNGVPDLNNIVATTGHFVAIPRYHTSEAAAASRYPGAQFPNTWESKFPTYVFQTQPNLVIGKKYYIVMTNTTAQFGQSSQANNVSLDCVRTGPVGYPTFKRNFRRDESPCWPTDEWEVFGQSTNGSWAGQGLLASMVLSGGGSYQGFPWSEVNASQGQTDRTHNISGSKYIRTAWWPPASTRLGRFYLYALKRYGSDPITMKVRQNGTVLYQTTLSGYPTNNTQDDLDIIGTFGDFVQITIPDTFTVSSASNVYFEISTGASTSYEINSFIDSSKTARYGSSDWCGSPNTHAEQSTNSGVSWTGLENYGIARDYMDIGWYVECLDLGCPV